MTAFSGLAAALVLGLSIYGAVPLITDRDQASGPVLTLEAHSSLAASGDAIQTPTPLQVGDTTPPTDFVIAPLTANDCPTQARTRDEVLAVLSTPPAPGSDLYVGNTSVDQSTLDAVNGTLRGWWACMLFGKPWNAMALESDQYLRELFYGNSQVSKAFSPSTLNELLDAREEASDARLHFGPIVGADMLMVLDVSNAVITPDQVPVRSVEADVFWVSPYTGELSNQSSLLFEFVWEDGAWKIRAINNFNGPPFPATR
ncbi:MAG: hypothetical protein ACTHQE_10445 [Thermomicrobiales bacterium]